MPLNSIRAWLGVDAPEKKQEFAPLRDTLDALDHMEPNRARFLASEAGSRRGRVGELDEGVGDRVLQDAVFGLRRGGEKRRHGGVITDAAERFGGDAANCR